MRQCLSGEWSSMIKAMVYYKNGGPEVFQLTDVHVHASHGHPSRSAPNGPRMEPWAPDRTATARGRTTAEYRARCRKSCQRPKRFFGCRGEHR